MKDKEQKILDKLLYKRLKRIFILLSIWIFSQIISYFLLGFPNTFLWMIGSVIFVLFWIVIDLGFGGLDDELSLGDAK